MAQARVSGKGRCGVRALAPREGLKAVSVGLSLAAAGCTWAGADRRSTGAWAGSEHAVAWDLDACWSAPIFGSALA